MGPRPGGTDRLPRRLRPRRGSHPGGVRDRSRALAPGRNARQPARLAGDHRPQPRYRPHPPGPHPRGEDTAPGRAGSQGERLGRDGDPGRAARAPVHVLPSGARDRCPGRADAANAGRSDDRRDRPRLPRPRADDGQAPRPREAQDRGGRNPVSGATGPSAARPPRRGARGRVPDLQRGLRRTRRPGGRGDPAGPRARGADARRGGGARPARVDAGERRPARRSLRRRHRCAPRRSGSIALGLRADRGGDGCPRPRAGARRPRSVRAAGGACGPPRGRAPGLAADRGPLRRARARDRLSGGRAEPGRGHRGSRRRRGRAGPGGAAGARQLPLPPLHAGGAAAPARSRRGRPRRLRARARARPLGG